MDSVDALLSLLNDPDPLVQDPLIARLGRDRDLLDRLWLGAQERGSTPTTLIGLALAADAEELIDGYEAADDLETGMWLLPRVHLPRIDYAAVHTPALD